MALGDDMIGMTSELVQLIGACPCDRIVSDVRLLTVAVDSNSRWHCYI